MEMEERNDGVGDGEEERRTGEDRELGVRALKKTGYPHGRPVRFYHRSFHRREFFGFRGDDSALEMAQCCSAMGGFAPCLPL